MNDIHYDTLALAAGDLNPPAEPDDAGCFEPFIRPVSVRAVSTPAPKPAPPSMTAVIDQLLRDEGYLPPLSDTAPEAGLPTPAAAESTGDADTAQPGEIFEASEQAPLPPPRIATALELVDWMTRSLLAQTHLPSDVAELIAFWSISTWFQDALSVLPCLVITGSAHDATVILHALRGFCRRPVLVAGFRRSDLAALHWSGLTNLISEPNLDKRTAALLSNLTDRDCLIAHGGSLARYTKSTAVYAGENPLTHSIQNSIRIHITPTNAPPPARPGWLSKMMAWLPVHLDQYREKNLDSVHHWTWRASGPSSETAAIATALGRGIVDAPELREKLVTLLQAHDHRQHSQWSATTESLLVEAVLGLCRQPREHAYTSEIADEANRLLKLRDERMKLSPETVGRRLGKLGLRTRRLTLRGNGLTFDKATVALIEQLAAVYVEEDLLADAENLHGT
jgi:hypothetical protein